MLLLGRGTMRCGKRSFKTSDESSGCCGRGAKGWFRGGGEG